MKSIEQLYNIARRTYILRLSIITIIPYAALTFLFAYFVLNDSEGILSALFRAFILSITFAIFSSSLTMITIFKKSKVIKHYNILYDKFHKIDKSLLLLLSLYLIQNKKIYSLEKKHYFNKQMKFLSKSFGISYNTEEDEEVVQEILFFAKSINFNDNND